MVSQGQSEQSSDQTFKYAGHALPILSLAFNVDYWHIPNCRDGLVQSTTPSATGGRSQAYSAAHPLNAGGQ